MYGDFYVLVSAIWAPVPQASHQPPRSTFPMNSYSLPLCVSYKKQIKLYMLLYFHMRFFLRSNKYLCVCMHVYVRMCVCVNNGAK